MNAVEIIVKKRDGEPLNHKEIKFFIDGYTAGKIPDYQASALFRIPASPSIIGIELNLPADQKSK